MVGHNKIRPAETGFQDVEETTVFHQYGEFGGTNSPTKTTINRDGKEFRRLGAFQGLVPRDDQ